jgi:hypothetical protein
LVGVGRLFGGCEAGVSFILGEVLIGFEVDSAFINSEFEETIFNLLGFGVVFNKVFLIEGGGEGFDFINNSLILFFSFINFFFL